MKVMRLYAVFIVYENDSEFNTISVKSYGRSEYEALGYVIKHNCIFPCKILDFNIIVCDGEPKKGSNIDTLENSE